ncbi:hypothetical protein PMAYCL1PPCAC_10794, partial [Pristionchus mayeri]
MSLHRVLVYGTLKSAHSNHSVLTESVGTQRLLGLAETVSPFPLVVGTALNVPFMLYARGQGHNVEGELYEVDDAKLARLDALEKHPVFYERKLEKVRILHCNETVDAWIYFITKWADDFMDKSSAPLVVFHENGEGSGRPFLSGRSRDSVTPEEGMQMYVDVIGHPPEGSPITHRVFVYGTLKKGQPNYSVLSDTEGTFRPRGSARSVSRFPLVVGTQFNIPFVLDKEGEGEQIAGEIYEVDDRKLEILDALEAHPILYERRLEKFVMDDSGVTSGAWIYIIHKWKDAFLDTCSESLASYSTDGTHGRPYVDRIAREKLMNEKEINLFREIMGYDPREESYENHSEKR